MIVDPRRKKQLEQFTYQLGLPPGTAIDFSLLNLALTHPSISRTENYEQLEFVGDSVVRLIAAELLLEIYPQEPVGEFAAVRSILVSDRVLAEFADSYSLEPYLLIGSNATGNPLGRQSWLADAFEAVLGALYLSTHNMELIRPWLDPALKARAIEVLNDPARFNYKDALQEWTQRKHKILPEYRVKTNPNFKSPGDKSLKDKSLEDKSSENESLKILSDAPAPSTHRFIAEVWLKGNRLALGSGRSKKASEQAAAKKAFLSVRDK